MEGRGCDVEVGLYLCQEVFEIPVLWVAVVVIVS